MTASVIAAVAGVEDRLAVPAPTRLIWTPGTTSEKLLVARLTLTPSTVSSASCAACVLIIVSEVEAVAVGSKDSADSDVPLVGWVIAAPLLSVVLSVPVTEKVCAAPVAPLSTSVLLPSEPEITEAVTPAPAALIDCAMPDSVSLSLETVTLIGVVEPATLNDSVP